MGEYIKLYFFRQVKKYLKILLIQQSSKDIKKSLLLKTTLSMTMSFLGVSKASKSRIVRVWLQTTNNYNWWYWNIIEALHYPLLLIFLKHTIPEEWLISKTATIPKKAWHKILKIIHQLHTSVLQQIFWETHNSEAAKIWIR